MSTKESNSEIVLFTVGDVTCGIDITSVHEIKKNIGITSVYGVDSDICGVINLRGQIVTVLEMRKRFGYDDVELTGEERIIIVPFLDEAVGLLVDSVEDAIVLERKDIQPVPPHLTRELGHFFTSVYQWDDRIIALVDLEQLVAVVEAEISSF